jgi:hypothetical protein
MKNVLIKNLSTKQSFVEKGIKCSFLFFDRRSLIKIQLQSIGTAIANSLMFFIHAAAFGYGSVLVENGEMNPIYVFR